MRRRFGLTSCILDLALFLSWGGQRASAALMRHFVVPFTSYTYDYWSEAIPAPQAYLPGESIDGERIGVGPLRGPSDLAVGPSGRVYIADTGNNRVVVADPQWRAVRIIAEFERHGSTDRLNRPSGIYVTEDERLYVADTENGRVVEFDADGGFVRIIGPPEPEVEGVLPANFNYRPLKLGVDNHGRMYVIARNVYEGLLSFSQDGRFRGFVGAPRVNPDFIDYLWSRISTAEQRARMQAFLPTEYSNLDLNDQGFVYATAVNREDTEGTFGSVTMVRLLNAKGEDLLRRNGFHPPNGDAQYPDRWSNATRRSSSTMADIVVHDLGVYSVLDNNRGRVFTYDENGTLLFVFGYRGNNHGMVDEPVAIDRVGRSILILDQQRGAVMQYEPTDYALLIWAAIEAYALGDYDATEAIWRRTLELNANFDPAYTGIGRALLRRGAYAEAMHYFRLGNNRRDYSEAFSLYRRGVVYERFASSVAVAGVAALGWAVYWRRRRTSAGSNRREGSIAATENSPGREMWHWLRYGFYAIFHPVEGFFQLKQAGSRPLFAALVVFAAVTGTFVASTSYTGFIFNHNDLTRVNVLMEAASVLVPFLLWTGVNWALTTLMDGKGRWVNIVIATSFATLPLVLTHAPMIAMSHYITAEEGTFYYFIKSIGALWTAVLIVLGSVMTTHEYDLTKAVWTCILTTVGVGFVMFLGFLAVNLSEQVYLFINELVTELLYRT